MYLGDAALNHYRVRWGSFSDTGLALPTSSVRKAHTGDFYAVAAGRFPGIYLTW